MRELSTYVEEGDVIDSFNVLLDLSSDRNREVINGSEGLASITLGYQISCSDNSGCESPTNIPTSEGNCNYM